MVVAQMHITETWLIPPSRDSPFLAPNNTPQCLRKRLELGYALLLYYMLEA